MGRKSIKENKNIYFEAREEAGLTRAAAAEKMEFISESRIDKIENEKVNAPYPDEVLAMAKAYGRPDLCNQYCSSVCAIGQKYVPKIQIDKKNLPQITLEVLSALNALDSQKDRLIEIASDGEISEDERADFATIKDHLQKMSLAIDSLNLWIEKTLDKA